MVNDQKQNKAQNNEYLRRKTKNSARRPRRLCAAFAFFIESTMFRSPELYSSHGSREHQHVVPILSSRLNAENGYPLMRLRNGPSDGCDYLNNTLAKTRTRHLTCLTNSANHDQLSTKFSRREELTCKDRKEKKKSNHSFF